MTGPQDTQTALQAFTTWPPREGDEVTLGHAPFLLAASLLLLPLPQWEAARRETLLQTLRTRGAADGDPGTSSGDLLSCALPALRLWGLVDWLQKELKRGAPAHSPGAWASRYVRMLSVVSSS
jgi:hypothetical protein